MSGEESIELVENVLRERYRRCVYNVLRRPGKFVKYWLLHVVPLEGDVVRIDKKGWKVLILRDGTLLTPKMIGASKRFIEPLAKELKPVVKDHFWSRSEIEDVLSRPRGSKGHQV